MRWTKEEKASRIGEVKTETKFLFTPVTIGKETRWMESATIEYKCVSTIDIPKTIFVSVALFPYTLKVDKEVWVAFKFIDSVRTDIDKFTLLLPPCDFATEEEKHQHYWIDANMGDDYWIYCDRCDKSLHSFFDAPINYFDFAPCKDGKLVPHKKQKQ